LKKLHVCTGHRAAVYALAPGFAPNHFFSAAGDRWVVEWDLDNPDNGHLAATTETQIYALAVLPGAGRRLVAGNMNGGLHWIDLDTPEQTRNVQHHQKGVFDLLVLDEWVFSAGGEGTLTRWEAATGQRVESFQLSNRSLRCIAHAPARSELVIGASDGCLYFLDAETLELKHLAQNIHQPSVFTVAYHPTLPLLLTGGRDAMLRVWHLPEPGGIPEAGLRLHSEQPAHWYTINHLVFSPNGHFFATASRDKTIKIWDAATFQLLKVADTIRDGGHINSVNRLLWMDDVLLSASDDRGIIIWEI
jgi:WD40 repeat protein